MWCKLNKFDIIWVFLKFISGTNTIIYLPRNDPIIDSIRRAGWLFMLLNDVKEISLPNQNLLRFIDGVRRVGEPVCVQSLQIFLKFKNKWVYWLAMNGIKSRKLLKQWQLARKFCKCKNLPKFLHFWQFKKYARLARLATFAKLFCEDSPDLSTIAKLFCEDSPDTLTFTEPFCEDTPDLPTFNTKPFVLDLSDLPTFAKSFWEDSPD